MILGMGVNMGARIRVLRIGVVVDDYRGSLLARHNRG